MTMLLMWLTRSNNIGTNSISLSLDEDQVGFCRWTYVQPPPM